MSLLAGLHVKAWIHAAIVLMCLSSLVIEDKHVCRQHPNQKLVRGNNTWLELLLSSRRAKCHMAMFGRVA